MNLIVPANILLTLFAQAGEAPGKESFDSAQASRFVQLYKKEAAEYEIYIGEQTKLFLKKDPVFRWAMPLDSNFNGTLFVWTRAGRVEVIGSIWSFPDMTFDGRRRLAHEFLTLASEPVRAQREQALAWSPPKTALDPRPIPGAPEPATTATHRLIQMRAMARDFSATELIGNTATEMRMLTQPIFRYEPEQKDSPDGAVFVFLNEFDPEAFLIIDERSTQNGRHWHFAFARFCRWSVAARHKDVEVWTCGQNATISDPQNTHYANFSASSTDWRLSDSSDKNEPSR